MTDRAVSDVVGFVLVFALVVSTIGIVTTVGFSSLETQENAEQLNNVERAFDVFQNNVENVYRDGAPSRATEMRLGGGTIGYGDPVNVTVRMESNKNVNHTITTTPLVYSHHGTDIVYEAGAVFREDEESSAMLSEPPFLLGTERTILPLVMATSSPGKDSISRSDTIRVRSELTNTSTKTHSALQSASTIEIAIESPRNEAWRRYLESNNGTEVESGSDEVVYKFKTDDLSVPRFRIYIDYIE